jgi:hypothetical protein
LSADIKEELVKCNASILTRIFSNASNPGDIPEYVHTLFGITQLFA